MRRILLLSVSLLLAPQLPSVVAPASAAGAVAADQPRTGEQCQRRNAGRRRAGSALGAIGRGVLGRWGGGSSVANAILPMGSVLGDAVMSLLDCDEQNKAANATEEAVRGGDVGDSASWRSDTRPGVTGTSTVTAADHSGGDDCLTVTDVIIVDGEETRAPKQMCRRPPSNRYVRI